MAKITLNLDPKNDQLVPVEALVNWSIDHLTNRSETWNFFKSSKEKTEKIGEINNVILNLRGKGGRAWFQKVFLQPFGGTATKEAKEIFDELAENDAFKNLEEETAESNGKIRPAILEAAKAAQELTNVISNNTNGLGMLIGNFSRAFMAGPGKTTAAPAPTAITKDDLLDKIIAKIASETASAAPAAEPTAAALGFGGPAGAWLSNPASTDAAARTPAKDVLVTNIVNALKNSTTQAAALKAIQGADSSFSTLNKDQIATALGTNITENLKRELYMSKKLLELGFVTENEHLAKLVEIRNILNEAPPASDINTFTPPIKAAISSIIGTAEDGSNGPLGVLLSTSAELQQGLTEYSKNIITERKLTPKERQLAKLYVKRAMLKEYIETGKLPKKENLNEFFGLELLLGAALAAVVAWAVGKLKDHFKNASTGENPSRPLNLPGNWKNLPEGYLQSMGGGINAEGELVDISGKKVSDLKDQLDAISGALTQSSTIIKAAFNDITANYSYIKDDTSVSSTMTPSYEALVARFNSEPAAAVQNLNEKLAELEKVI